MKNINEYSVGEWFFLKPLIHFIKQIRNDLIQEIYYLFGRGVGRDFLAKNQYLIEKNIIVVVAFEQPEVLSWLIRLFRKNVTNWILIVCDNSRSLSLKKQIADICIRYDVPYLSLPKNITRHPNRSHGMAMNWIFYKIIKPLRPCKFGYLDHDMLPIQLVGKGIDVVLSNQACYGLIKKKGHRWNLWAGYSFFKYDKLENLSPNFLYDFTCGLDTGGRNWEKIYKYLDVNDWRFVLDNEKSLTLSTGEQRTVNMIDGWVHIGAISYKNTLDNSHAYFKQLVADVESGYKLII